MKKVFIITIFVLLGCFAAGNLAGAEDMGMSRFFPDIKGMTKKEMPEIYTPENLYEYIDGAADVFLGYDFQQLASLTYEDKQRHSLIIDIYRHSSANNGFGIYSAEKPLSGDFLDIGAQGYYEKGVLNFVQGSYYVKMSCFDLAGSDKSIMTAAAREVAGRLGPGGQFPLTVTCFPGKGKIENSERYMAQNFLGHSFLHSAFTADYQAERGKFQVFIIEAADAAEARKILESYVKFARGKGSEVSEADGYYHFLDPYYRSSGKMNIKIKGKYIWGLFDKDQARAAFFIGEIGKNLARLPG